MPNASNWTTVTESQFTWEREALAFVRDRFPDHEPYRAWSNFEFIADDGSINEVDLLVFSPHGFFLIEIKSRPGRLFGDAGTWQWETEGKLHTRDNPFFLANSKAKKLRSLLQRQRASKNHGTVPFIEALIFCSAEALQCELKDTAANRVCLRDRDQTDDQPARAGIMAAITRRDCLGLDGHPKGTLDKPTARMIGQAIEQAGIRPSQRNRKVSDYLLEQLIGDGQGYQDWLATHVRLRDVKRRIRIYHVRTESSAEERERNERAALREFQLFESLQHPGVLRIFGLSEHALGPALVFEHDPRSIRLDHFLAQKKGTLGVDMRLDFMRQIAEVVRFAHEKKVVHRALCPQSIVVTDLDRPRPRLKVFNWQAGYREASSTFGSPRGVSATSHVDRFVESASTAYLAPESIAGGGDVGEHLDIFSLGAIAYHLFSGEPPAANGLELSSKLRETKGLQISSAMNGAGNSLQDLIKFATYPEVNTRLDSAVDFLDRLDTVENELTAPEQDYVTDPALAQQGSVLPGDIIVQKRLGQGACSVALLVEHQGETLILKVASDVDQSPRIRDEAEVLAKLRHQHIVEFCGSTDIGDHAAFFLRPVLVDRDRVETLGQRLRKEGRLHIEMLERFGADLLDVVNYLQEQGIAHRDIKPDNIAVGSVGKGDTLHVVLFDFSLARTPADNIRAGTRGYLDPLLPLRQPPRWDLHAERYAAAATLYELATGSLPRWGDGTTEPSHLDCEITIDAELFDPGLREQLSAFFRKAFRRDIRQRFDNAEEMLREWRRCFEDLERTDSVSNEANEAALRALLAHATIDTTLHELGLGTRAVNVLDRANLLTVEDLLTFPMRRLLRLRGVGTKTRREIASAVNILRERLDVSAAATSSSGAGEIDKGDESLDPGQMSVDLLVSKLLPAARAGASKAPAAVIPALLGLSDGPGEPWPGQAGIAHLTGLSRARVSQVIGKLQERWAKEPAVTRVRTDLRGILESAGGAMAVAELAEALILARGSMADEPVRTRRARAVVRAAVEVERSMGDPRFQVRRDGDRVVIALSQDLASYAFRLGDAADALAAEDPLVTPQRVLERLRAVARPDGADAIVDSRLTRLAVAASCGAALSGRQEIYPRGMEPGRAIKLSQGALHGVKALTVDDVRERVRSRYPEAAPLPDPPALDALLKDAGFDFGWNPIMGGVGGYESRARDSLSISSRSESSLRASTDDTPPRDGPRELTSDEADARQFDERLTRGLKEGSFYTLMVNPRYYQQAREKLARRFPVEIVDFEALFLNKLREVVDKAGARWDAVVNADAVRGDARWDKFMVLVKRAMPLVERQLSQARQPMLVIYAGLLARYSQMDLIERLRDQIGRRDGIPSLWLLVPGDHQPLMDGTAIPLLSPGQRVRVPEQWLRVS